MRALPSSAKHLPKALPFNIITLGIRISTYEMRGRGRYTPTVTAWVTGTHGFMWILQILVWVTIWRKRNTSIKSLWLPHRMFYTKHRGGLTMTCGPIPVHHVFWGVICLGIRLCLLFPGTVGVGGCILLLSLFLSALLSWVSLETPLEIWPEPRS